MLQKSAGDARVEMLKGTFDDPEGAKVWVSEELADKREDNPVVGVIVITLRQKGLTDMATFGQVSRSDAVYAGAFLMHDQFSPVESEEGEDEDV